MGQPWKSHELMARTVFFNIFRIFCIIFRNNCDIYLKNIMQYIQTAL